MNRKTLFALLGTVVFLFATNLAATSINLLSNPGFETAATGVTAGTTVTDALNYTRGSSAAADWDVFSNKVGTIATTLLPSTLTGGGNFMIEVNTTGYDGGLVQDFLTSTATSATASAWVFIKSGCVGIGSGNDGDTGIDTSTCTTGKWIDLTAPNGSKPVTAFLVYDISQGADFLVDNAAVMTGSTTTTPEPATLAMFGTGLLILAGFARRRKRAL